MKGDAQQFHDLIKNPDYKMAVDNMRTLLEERIKKDIGVKNPWNKKFKAGSLSGIDERIMIPLPCLETFEETLKLKAVHP